MAKNYSSGAQVGERLTVLGGTVYVLVAGGLQPTRIGTANGLSPKQPRGDLRLHIIVFNSFYV
jgi:hypothetical protein